jgi:formamidopyrimidine-DNA glycosylase
MSFELPEALIIAEQMKKELIGKRVKSYQLKDYERLQKIGMLNKDITSFDQLINREIKSIVSRGNVILVKLDDEVNLILGPEYGGKIFYHESLEKASNKFHLRVVFTDGTVLTTRLTSMGVIYVMKDEELIGSYARALFECQNCNSNWIGFQC